MTHALPSLMPQPSDLRRVVVIQTAFLGDVLLTFSLVNAVKNAGAEFVCVVTKPGTAEAMREAEGVDQVTSIEKHSSLRGLQATWHAGIGLRQYGFSCALIPHRSFRSGFLAKAIGAPIRVGFKHNAGSLFLTHAVHRHAALPDSRRNESLLIPFQGASALNGEPWFVAPREVDSTQPVQILIAPGSQWDSKRWPAVYYRRVIERCVEIGWNVSVAGSEQEAKLCAELCSSFASMNIQNISGLASWREYLSHVDSATVVVSNDSAAVHAANSCRVPVVALFGPTVPEFGFAPRGLLDTVIQTNNLICRPCNAHGGDRCPIGTHQCMMDISPDEVFRAVHNIVRTRYEHANS